MLSVQILTHNHFHFLFCHIDYCNRQYAIQYMFIYLYIDAIEPSKLNSPFTNHANKRDVHVSWEFITENMKNVLAL